MSKFQVGTKVALVYYGSFGDGSISERTVSKVRKDGKFFTSFQRRGENGEMETVQSDTMWSPQKYSDEQARKSGKADSRYSREHIEIWTPEHDARIAEKAARATANNAKALVVEAVKQLDPRRPGDRETIAKLHQMLSDRNLSND